MSRDGVDGARGERGALGVGIGPVEEALQLLGPPAGDAVEMGVGAHDLAGAVLEGAEGARRDDLGEADAGNVEPGELEGAAGDGIGKPGLVLGLKPGKMAQFALLHPAASGDHRDDRASKAEGEADAGHQHPQPAKDVAEKP